MLGDFAKYFHRWKAIYRGAWNSIVNAITVLFLVCIYRVYFVAIFLLLKILLLLLAKILVWYLETLSILLVVLSVVACLHGMSLRTITNALFDL
jgi:hypothetical protein